MDEKDLAGTMSTPCVHVVVSLSSTGSQGQLPKFFRKDELPPLYGGRRRLLQNIRTEDDAEK